MVLGAWDWEGLAFYPFPSNTLWTSRDEDIRPRSIGPRRVGRQSDGSSLVHTVWVTEG